MKRNTGKVGKAEIVEGEATKLKRYMMILYELMSCR